MKNRFITLSLLLLLFSAGTTFAQGIYMEVAAPGGGNQSVAYTGEILLSSVQYSFSNTATIGSSTGGTGGGKAMFGPVLLTKQLDPSSASLQKALFLGQHYQRIRLNFYRAGTSGRELAYQVVLGTAVVADYSVGAEAGCQNGCPALAETIKIEYGQVVTREFVNGTPTRVTTWNYVTNTSNVDSFLLATN